LLVAGISAVVAFASAALSRRTQLRVTRLTAERDRQSREEERRSAAKVALDKYRGPLLDAAWQFGDRVDNIRNGDFLSYLSPGSGREQDAKLSTLFRVAYYFGWREVVRTEVQLLRFENEDDTRLVSGFLADIARVFAVDRLDAARAMLWADEQRGIGELMINQRADGSSFVRGHAAFYDTYKDVFAPWMERLAGDLLSPAARESHRLRLLQWALFGLVQRLDEEGAYFGGWMDRSLSEIRELNPLVPVTTTAEEHLRKRLAAIDS